MRQYATLQEYRFAQAEKAVRRNAPAMRRAFWAMKAENAHTPRDASAMQAAWHERYLTALETKNAGG